MSARFAALAALFSASLSTSGAWRQAGTIGQSGTADGAPVAQLAVRVAADAAGNVVFDGKWFARPGEKKPRALSKTLAGTVMGDGERIYCVSLYGTTVREAAIKDDALVQAGEPIRVADAKGAPAYFAIAPAKCNRGFCASVKFAVLDRAALKVYGFAADGSDAGVLLDYSAHDKAKLFSAVGFLPETGDLLVSTGYPEERIRRFRPGGEEVLNPMWPCKAHGLIVFSGGRTWALSSSAVAFAEAASPSLRIGRDASSVSSIAHSGDVVWLGTSQGALAFNAAHPERCITHFGGPGEVRALAIADGRVFAFVGARICQYWLDDLPDEPMSSADVGWLWRIGGKYSGAVTAVGRRADGLLHFDFEDAGKTTRYAFDWSQTLWMQRAKRLFVVEGDGAMAPQRPADMPEGDYTAVAVEGDWMVAYSPSRMAIVKFKREAK